MTRTAAPGHLTRAALHLMRVDNIPEAALNAELDRSSSAALKFLREKAAVSAGTLDAATWGSAMADEDGAAGGFIESLRSMSLFYAMAPMANLFPMLKRIVAAAAIAAPADRAEAGFIPVVAGSFSAVSLAPRMSGGIVVLSETLVRATDSASFAVLQRELQKAVVAAVDTAVLADEILAGVTPGTLSAAAPLTQLRAMLDAVNTAGAGKLLWAVAPNVANYLSTASLTGTGRLFPECTPAGGVLLGAPVIVSDRLAAGRIVLIDASGFAVNPGTIDVAQSRAASLQLVDDPSGVANEVSLFQTNNVALRIVASYAIERMRTGSVAIADLGA